MKSKILDISLQHDINTMLFESLPLCIVLGKPNLQEWFFNHYINLYITSAKNNDKYRYFKIRHTECSFYSNYSKIDEVITTSLIESKVIHSKINIVDFLKENINNDTYAIVFLNEWAIPHKPSYHKNHWYHESMVYGYDDNKGVLHCISFDERHSFAKFEVDYHSFWDGFQLVCHDASDIGAYQRYVRLLKASKMQYTFDLHSFAHQLNHYINGTLDLVDIYNFDLIDLSTERDDWEYAIGYKVYDRLIDILEHYQDVTDEFLKYVNFHILFEHKRLMLKRLHFLNDRFFSGKLHDIIGDYADVVRAFDRIRLINIKFHQMTDAGKRDKEKTDAYILKTNQILRDNKDRERDILKRLHSFIIQGF